MKYAGQGSFAGKRVAISGSGNVAQYAALKCIELGATVVSLSDSKGCLVAEGDARFTPEDVEAIAAVKLERKALTAFAGRSAFRYIEGARPWVHVGRVDVALPCATQNEVSEEEARELVANGTAFVAEGSNSRFLTFSHYYCFFSLHARSVEQLANHVYPKKTVGCTQAAIDVFEGERKKAGKGGAGQTRVWYAPGKASNCGGVAVSGLEMAQNSQRLSWTRDEVDEKLKAIMRNAFENGLRTAQEYVATTAPEELPSLVAGSNIAGFVKVVEAMADQGDWWASKTQQQTAAASAVQSGNGHSNGHSNGNGLATAEGYGYAVGGPVGGIP